MAIGFHDVDTVPGWFDHLDFSVFDALLRAQAESGLRGDLVEVGPFQGRCAVVLGAHLEEGDSLRVVDLFGLAADDAENRAEVAWNSYDGLSVDSFLGHYHRFHRRAPEVVQGESKELLERLDPGSVRFLHIDGSHTMEVVRRDILQANGALIDGGVLVIDDFRTEHAPGVAAAVWPLVSQGAVRPFVLTPQKLYATTAGHEGRYAAAVQTAVTGLGYTVDEHRLGGEARTLRVSGFVDVEPSSPTETSRRSLDRPLSRVVRRIVRGVRRYPRQPVS